MSMTPEERARQASLKRLEEFAKKIKVLDESTNVLLPDNIVGHLLCVYLNLYTPENDIYKFHIGVLNSTDITWNPWKIYQKKEIWETKFTLGQKTTALITQFKRIIEGISKEAIRPNSSQADLIPQYKQKIKFVEELLQKYEPYETSISDIDLKKINEDDDLRDTLVLVITINKKQYKNLRKFLEEYMSLYSEKELEGQGNFYAPEFCADAIMDYINNPEYVKKYGYKNLRLHKTNTTLHVKSLFTNPAYRDVYERNRNYCHSLMYLVFQKQIRLRRLMITPNSVDVNFDNLHGIQGSNLNATGIVRNWPAGFVWVSDTLYSLGDNDQIKFGKPNSDRIKLFKKLTEARGEWVSVNDMSAEINKTDSQVRTILGQINSENLQNKAIELAPRNDKNKQGAYRIIINTP